MESVSIREILDTRVRAYNSIVDTLQKTQKQLQQLIAEQLRIEGEIRILHDMLKEHKE